MQFDRSEGHFGSKFEAFGVFGMINDSEMTLYMYCVDIILFGLQFACLVQQMSKVSLQQKF